MCYRVKQGYTLDNTFLGYKEGTHRSRVTRERDTFNNTFNNTFPGHKTMIHTEAGFHERDTFPH